jgi:hypothetical protein
MELAALLRTTVRTLLRRPGHAVLVGATLALGIGGATLTSRALGAVLFEVRPWDAGVYAGVYAGVVVVPLVVACLAALRPALRASRTPPARVLEENRSGGWGLPTRNARRPPQFDRSVNGPAGLELPPHSNPSGRATVIGGGRNLMLRILYTT